MVVSLCPAIYPVNLYLHLFRSDQASNNCRSSKLSYNKGRKLKSYQIFIPYWYCRLQVFINRSFDHTSVPSNYSNLQYIAESKNSYCYESDDFTKLNTRVCTSLFIFNNLRSLPMPTSMTWIRRPPKILQVKIELASSCLCSVALSNCEQQAVLKQTLVPCKLVATTNGLVRKG